MKYAIIQSGIVTNAVLASPEYAAEQGWVELPEGAGIGWAYADGQFTAPPPPPPAPPPAVVSMRQARLALLNKGKLGNVTSAIAGLTVPKKEEAQIEWEYSTEVRRDSNLVKQLAPSLGLSETDLDDLFRLAATL